MILKLLIKSDNSVKDLIYSRLTRRVYEELQFRIISHHPTFKNKNLRQYYVDGINTVGAWGDEPFEIKFTNHTSQKVQVKISVDGTDVLTGDLATTEVSKEMWVVNGYGTLSLQAWPETNNGGARFVFTSVENGVATHTHGNLSSRGIIAAAVYTESYVEPIRYYPLQQTWTYPSPYFIGGTFGSGSLTIDSVPLTSNVSDQYFNTAEIQCNNSANPTKSLEKLVAVGAGQHVNQKINYVSGLIKPMFTESIRVKYMWWDDLVAKLRTHHNPTPHASGFPGDSKQLNINLGKTPRIGSSEKSTTQLVEPNYVRV